MPRYLPIALAAAVGIGALGVPALRAQTTPGDMRDMVRAHSPQADGEMARRGYARVRVEGGGDRTWTWWWNEGRRTCLSINIERGRYESIVSVPPADCRRGNGGPGWGGPPGRPGNDGPGWGGGRPDGIPAFAARCPTRIEVRADRGGPIYINDRQARLTVQRRDYFEAKSGRITISVSRDRERTLSVSYTGPNRANGICRVIRY